MRGTHPASLTPADVVTLVRLGLLGLLAGLLTVGGLLPGAGPALWPVVGAGRWEWVVLAVAVPMLLLDAVDGAVARRTQVTARGARWDMETDAAVVAVLSLAAAPLVGAWVLLAGAMRYGFVVAGWWWPALRRPLPYSLARRVVAAVQAPALLLPLTPGVPTAAAVLGCLLALLALTWSFGRDALWLARCG